MKRLIALVACLALISGFASTASAAVDDTCAMSVTVIVGAEVEVTDDPLAFGNVNAGAQDVSDSACTVTNTGSALNEYQLAVTDKPSEWSIGTPGWNIFRLCALFTSDSSPATGDFSTSDDDVTAGNQTATISRYAQDAEGDDVKGHSCTKTAVRKLWFMFDAPTGTNLGGAQQWITVTVTAVAM